MLGEHTNLKKTVADQQEALLALASNGVEDHGGENGKMEAKTKKGKLSESGTLASALASAAAADEIRNLAATQAKREEELVSYRRQIAALETQLQTLDQDFRAATSEARKVKEELDGLKRQEGRANVDME